MKKQFHIVTTIFVFTLIWRILFILISKEQFLYSLLPYSDCLYYHNWASEIAGGNFIGNRVFFGMPLYPYFLAFIYRLFGPVPAFAHIIQILMGGLNAVLVYFIAKKVFNERVAVISSLAFGIYVMFIFYEILLMSVTLIVLLNSLLILLALKIQENSSWPRIFVLSLLFGLASLAEAGIILFFMLVIFWLIASLKNKTKKEKLNYVLILVLGVFLASGLVVARNYFVGKDFVMITAHSGINFFIGNNPAATGGVALPAYIRPTQKGVLEDSRIYAEKELGRKLRSSEISSFWFNKALEFIRTKPRDYLNLEVKKIRIFWMNFEPMDTTEFYLLRDKSIVFKILTHSFGIVASLGLVGILLSLAEPNKSQIRLLIIFIFSQFFAAVIYFVTSRNRLVTVPFLIIFASYFLNFVYEKIKGKGLKKILMPAVSFLGIFALINLNNPKYEYAAVERSYNLGCLYSLEGSFDKAEASFKQAIELKPQEYMSYYALGNVYALRSEMKKAIQLYEKAVSLNPNFVDAYYNLGHAYMKLGDFKKAQGFFKLVADLDLSAYDAHFNLGNIYKKQGKCKEALIHYDKIPTDDPRYYSQVLPMIKECQK